MNVVLLQKKMILFLCFIVSAEEDNLDLFLCENTKQTRSMYVLLSLQKKMIFRLAALVSFLAFAAGQVVRDDRDGTILLYWLMKTTQELETRDLKT